MIVARIAKTRERARDLTGKGAFLYGGRWNNEGTFMLYTSINISLAMLEVLVHADESEIPPHMYISQIEIIDSAPIYKFQDKDLPKRWRETDNLQLKNLGDRLMAEKKYLGIQVRSAVLPSEFNVLLNPLFPGYGDMVRVHKVDKLATDARFL